MTRWGVGPKFGIISLLYSVIMLCITRFFYPHLSISLTHYPLPAGIGILLILLGFPFYLLAVVSVMRAFTAGKLVTTGVYAMCRHPLYGSWVVFIVPGLALLLNSWPLLTAPPVMYFVARFLVKKEDTYLENTFGQEYQTYKQKVPALLPYGRFKKGS